MLKSPFKPGDVVTWGSYGKCPFRIPNHINGGFWPDLVVIVANEGKATYADSGETMIIGTLDGDFTDGGYSWVWFTDKHNQPLIDRFRTEVRKSRNHGNP